MKIRSLAALIAAASLSDSRAESHLPPVPGRGERRRYLRRACNSLMRSLY